VYGKVDRLSQRSIVYGPFALKQYLAVSPDDDGDEVGSAPAPGIQAYVKLATVIAVRTLEVKRDRFSSGSVDGEVYNRAEAPQLRPDRVSCCA